MTTQRDLTVIAQHYIAAVLFTDAGDLEDEITGREDFAPDALEQVAADVAKFVASAGDLLTDEWSDEQVGHDIWLTRNHNGVGFWARDLPNGDELTKIANEMGEKHAVLGDDGLIYIE